MISLNEHIDTLYNNYIKLHQDTFFALKNEYDGKIVYILFGKYKGRKGILDFSNYNFDNFRKKIIVRVKIFRLDNKGFIEDWERSFISFDNLDLVLADEESKK